MLCTKSLLLRFSSRPGVYTVQSVFSLEKYSYLAGPYFRLLTQLDLNMNHDNDAYLKTKIRVRHVVSSQLEAGPHEWLQAYSTCLNHTTVHTLQCAESIKTLSTVQRKNPEYFHHKTNKQTKNLAEICRSVYSTQKMTMK